MKLENSKNIKRSNQITMYIHGDPMVGKTTLATTFPKPVVISTDGNVKGFKNEFAVYRLSSVGEVEINGATQRVTGWDALKMNIDKILNMGFETIVIDLLAQTRDICRESLLRKAGVKDESDIPFGKMYRAIEREFNGFIKRLKASGKNIIFLGHSFERDNKREIDINKKMLSFVMSEVDFAVNLELVNSKEGIKRILRTKQNTNFEGGSRFDIEDIEEPTYEKIKHALDELEKGDTHE